MTTLEKAARAPSKEALQLIHNVRDRLGGDFFLNPIEAAQEADRFATAAFSAALLEPSDEDVEVAVQAWIASEGNSRQAMRSALRAAGVKITGSQG
jgi:hypothetical protein